MTNARVADGRPLGPGPAAAAAVLTLAWAAAAFGDVHDNAHLFGQVALDDANTVMGQMEKQYHKQLVVETFPAVPDGQRSAADHDKAGFFRDWMAGRAKALKVNGVYVLICLDPRYVEVGAGRETRARGVFTVDDLTRLHRQLQSDLQTAGCDAALAGAVDLVARAYAANIPGAKPIGQTGGPGRAMGVAVPPRPTH